MMAATYYQVTGATSKSHRTLQTSCWRRRWSVSEALEGQAVPQAIPSSEDGTRATRRKVEDVLHAEIPIAAVRVSLGAAVPLRKCVATNEQDRGETNVVFDHVRWGWW